MQLTFRRGARRRSLTQGGKRNKGVGLGRGREHFVSQAQHPYAIPATTLGLQKAQYIERSEEHTSELQSLMRISYAVFCLKKKKTSIKKNKKNKNFTVENTHTKIQTHM